MMQPLLKYVFLLANFIYAKYLDKIHHQKYAIPLQKSFPIV